MTRENNPKLLSWGSQTYIMGILNITPDSFSGDGLLNQEDPITKALNQASDFVKAGATILDIGGESTRPGANIISTEEEISRIVPIIQRLSNENLGAIISIDTYKAPVAEAAINAGADWVNDVWGLKADAKMAEIIAKYNVPIVIMHNRSNPANVKSVDTLGSRYADIHYENLICEIIADLNDSLAIAQKAGVDKKNIIIDPGLGFGKTVEQNLLLLNNLNELKVLECPILVGPSRKSFIGYTLNKPPNQRLFGTAAVVSFSIMQGADIIRVHDVKEMAEVVKMIDSIRLTPYKW